MKIMEQNLGVNWGGVCGWDQPAILCHMAVLNFKITIVKKDALFPEPYFKKLGYRPTKFCHLKEGK